MRVKRRRQRREDGDGGIENDPNDVAGAREVLEAAVETVARAIELPGADTAAEYAEQRWRLPLERAMASADAYSLVRAAAPPTDGCGRHGPPGAVETAELARLAASVGPDDPDGVRKRLEARKTRMSDAKPVPCPPQLVVEHTTVEDPLEARRDSRGRAAPLARNVIGEHYATHSSPLSYTRGRTAAEIYARVKLAVREDLRTRDARRIAALNQRERERKRQLVDMGLLSPEAALEARFDHMMRRESAEPTA